MSTVSASEARQTLPSQLDRVAAGEEVAITRHGRVVALLVPPRPARTARTAQLWESADRLWESIVRAGREPLAAPAAGSERADELVRGIRDDRDARDARLESARDGRVQGAG